MGALSYQSKSQQTIDIELMLRDGHSVSDVARWAGVSKQRVSFIKRRASTPSTPVASTPPAENKPSPCNVVPVLKQLTLRLTPSVFDALTEACSITNRKDPDEPITIEDYINELVVLRLVELGLLRKNKRK